METNYVRGEFPALHPVDFTSEKARRNRYFNTILSLNLAMTMTWKPKSP